MTTTAQLNQSSAPPPSEEPKVYACTTCVQRKVRCDKRQPCSACEKSRLHCTYRSQAPSLTRKRKLGASNQTLVDRIRSHEAALRNAGLPFEAFDDSNDVTDDHDEGSVEPPEHLRARPQSFNPIGASRPATKTSLPHRGILVPEHGGIRYYEHGLVGALGQEFRQNPINFLNQHDLGDVTDAGVEGTEQDALDLLGSSVLTGSPSTPINSRHQHPPPNAVMKYWSIFAENVHPLTKIIHAPTVHQIIVDNDSDMSKGKDALRFSIYACAVATLTDKECQTTFGRSQTSLLRQFQSATRSALSESSFLRVPEINLLRAHVLFLTSMFLTADPSSLWILMGSGIRMAQSQGLHRDGSTLGLPPFETEMRRRLWWYIVTLDARLSELVGSQSSLLRSTDTALPSNLNDSDLSQDMTSFPASRSGTSEMTFCLVKYEITRFMQENDPRLDKFELATSSQVGGQAEKRDVSELESFLEGKFLRFCDPVIPVQFLTTTMARSSLCKLKQMEHRRRHRPSPEDERTSSLEQTKMTMNIAARNVQYDNLIHNSKSLQRFLWHVHFYFPWGAPIVVLKILAAFSEWDDDMQAAWSQMEELHEHHPEYREKDKVMHLIIGGLTLKAWSAHTSFLESRGKPQQRPPGVLAALQTKQSAYMLRYNDNRAGTMMATAIDEMDYGDLGQFDNFDFTGISFVDANWPSWDTY